jgi:nitrogen fixation NifU-like protein
MHGERLLDHFRNPRNVGELPPPAIVVDVENPICGDTLRLSVLLETDIVAEVRFKTRGCTASIATSSALTEWLISRRVPELRALQADQVEELVGGLIPESKHAAVLCVDAVKALLKKIAKS